MTPARVLLGVGFWTVLDLFLGGFLFFWGWGVFWSFGKLYFERFWVVFLYVNHWKYVWNWKLIGSQNFFSEIDAIYSKKNTYKTLIHISKLRTINSIWFQFRKKSNRFNNLIKSKTCFFIIEIIKLHNYYRTKRSLVHIFHQQSIVIMKKINETFLSKSLSFSIRTNASIKVFLAKNLQIQFLK